MSMFDPFKIFDPGGKGVFGSKPVIPESADYAKALADAAKSNLKLIPDLSRLGALSTEQLLKQLEIAMPGYGDMLNKGTSAIQSQLKGEIPDDVARAVSRHSAERSRTGGYAGSEFSDALEARDLGLTSLDIINKSLSTAERWMSQAQNRTFDFSRMFMSPDQAIAGAESKFQRDLLAAGVEAAPDPVARGRYDTELAILGMVLSIYSGGAGYTGQYKPQTNYSSYGGGNGGPGGGGGNGSYFGTGSQSAYEGGGPDSSIYGSSEFDYSQYDKSNSFDAVDVGAFAGFV